MPSPLFCTAISSLRGLRLNGSRLLLPNGLVPDMRSRSVVERRGCTLRVLRQALVQATVG